MAGLMGEALGDTYVSIMAETSALQAGLFRARAMTQAFSQTAGIGITRGLTAALVGIPMVIGGAMVYSIKKFMEAEIVSNRLASAISMVGDNANISMPALTRLADAIAMKTKWDDEAVKSAMASAAALGFNTKQIEQAMPAVVGLAARLNMGLGGAMRLTVRASQGHTQMLQRYGLQLDKNMTAEQKYQAVLKYGLAGMNIAEAETQTLSGAFGQMRKAISEVAESYGGIIVQNTAVTSSIAEMTKSIWGLKTAADASAETGFFTNFMGAVAIIWTRIATGFKLVWVVFTEVIALIVQAWRAGCLTLIRPIAYVLSAIKAAWTNLFGWLKDLISEIWTTMVNPFHKFKMPEFRGVFAGMRGNWRDTLNNMIGDWQVVGDNLAEWGIFTGPKRFEGVLDAYTKRMEVLNKSIGPTRDNAMALAGTAGKGIGEQAKASIISIADVWKKSQEDVVKTKHNEEMKTLAQQQLAEQIRIRQATEGGGEESPYPYGDNP